MPRKWLSAVVLAGCVLLALVFLRNISITENIDSMLPDDDSGTARDFRLLSRSPFLSKVLVVLEGGPGTTQDSLVLAAENIASAAGPPWFRPVNSEAGKPAPGEAISHLLSILPVLLNEDDLNRIQGMLSPDSVRLSLEKARQDLLGLEGLGMKQIVQIDPLQLRLLILDKMSRIDIFGIEPGPGPLIDNAFLSPDRKSALIVLDPTVSMTDSRGSQEMLEHLEKIIEVAVGKDIQTHTVSGHVYAAANAAAIGKDLGVVLTVSLMGILAVFLIFLRTWQGVLVYVIPLGAMLAGVVAAAGANRDVSGVTIGFGAVLMGLSVDYGLHVFYALNKGENPGRALDRVARPILFCWLTTAGVFSLLLLSSLPGQRQLALFTVAGLSAAMVLALMALPAFISPGGLKPSSIPRPCLKIPVFKNRNPAIAIFLGLVLGAAFCWPGVRFDGRLQALSIVPEDLARAEQIIAESWGDVRGMAMIFSDGQDLDTAMARAAQVYEYISTNLPEQRIVSLAPLLPPDSQQRAAAKRWEKFWEKHGSDLQKTFAVEAQVLGFTPDAFARFFDYIFSTPGPAAIDDLRALGLGDLVEMLISQDSQSVSVITMVPDNPEILGLLSPVHNSLSETIPGSRLVSQERLGQEIAASLRADMSRFLMTAALFVAGMSLLLFRNVRRAFQALVPALAGLSALILAAVILKVEFNLYSMAAAFLVLGLGVDYGIFMASQGPNRVDMGTRQAVLVSGLTTLVGFGALILADHPALYSIGLTVIAGIAAAIPAALFVVPALEKQYVDEQQII